MTAELPLAHQTPELVERLFDHIKNHETDLAPGTMAIDPKEYVDEELAARERETIFGTVPVGAAHCSELPRPNDFVVVQLPNNEAIVVRQEDGSVKAFVNSCLHRGAKLAEEVSGSKRIFSCRYHGWSYNTDGSLRSIAQSQSFGDAGPNCSSLVELPAEERFGIVWVVDNPSATIDLDEWLGEELQETLEPYAIETYTVHRAETFEEPVNWKALMDAFVDAYHLATTHPQTAGPYFYNNTQIWEPLGRHGRQTNARKSIDSVLGEDPAEVDLAPHTTLGVFFMPNMTLLRQPDHLEMLSFMPHPTKAGVSRTTIRVLAPQPAVTDAERERWDKNWRILMRVLRDEDLVLNRALQQSLGNKDVPNLILGRNEIANQHFHSWYSRAMADPKHLG